MVISYKLDKAIIVSDLSTERPEWILSAYGPGREAPLQLFGAYPREQSFEELRVRHYELSSKGNHQQAIQEAQALVSNANQQIQTALNDVEGAIKYIVNGEGQHPNRIDVCKMKAAVSAQPQVFRPNQITASTLSQPSMSAPAFGQPHVPSAVEQFAGPTFGRPSAPAFSFVQPSKSIVGQSPTLGQPATFERPITSLGQPPQSFINSSSSASSINQMAGQTSSNTPLYSQTSTGVPVAPSGKQQSPAIISGQINQFGNQTAALQKNSVGQSANLSQQSLFGNSALSNPSHRISQPTSTGASVGYRQASDVLQNPFAQSKAQAPGTLGQRQNAGLNPFGETQTSQSSTTNQAVPVAGQSFMTPKLAQLPRSLESTGTSQTSLSRPVATGVQAQKDSQGRIKSWKGKGVSYVDSEPCYQGVDSTWQKIWFPDGPPVFRKTTDLPDESYNETAKDDYQYLKEHGTFKNGIIPELPPKREWCSWNF